MEQKWQQEFDELRALTNPTPAQKRRIAELYELSGDDETAYMWWGYAAVAGDRDAVYMLEEIDEGREGKGGRLRAVHTDSPSSGVRGGAGEVSFPGADGAPAAEA